MTPNLDVATIQRALDALIAGDHPAATELFADDIEMIGAGGCLNGHTNGLPAVLDRFVDMYWVTGGTFGTEVETVYGGSAALLVAVTRHWASIDGSQVTGRQALLVTVDSGRIRTVNALSPDVPRSRIWD